MVDHRLFMVKLRVAYGPRINTQINSDSECPAFIYQDGYLGHEGWNLLSAQVCWGTYHQWYYFQLRSHGIPLINIQTKNSARWFRIEGGSDFISEAFWSKLHWLACRKVSSWCLRAAGLSSSSGLWETFWDQWKLECQKHLPDRFAMDHDRLKKFNTVSRAQNPPTHIW